MTSPVKLSVVTPSFNCIHTIRDTLESVARQDYSHVEHIVVDGGSVDGTLDVLKQYPHLRWISEKDEGHYHAMNKGIKMATGDFIAILNADDYYCPGILSKIAGAIAANPDWDAIFGDYIFVDDNGNEIFRRREACWDAQIVRFGFNMAFHQALFVSRTTYERLGPLRHKDFKNCCDVEFATRMAHAGCKVGNIHEFVVFYRFHQHGQSADKRVSANMDRESARIRQEYGVPGGMLGRALGCYARAKRQLQKLLILHTCDIVPGRFHLRKHMREKTQFSSNIGVDKLPQL